MNSIKSKTCFTKEGSPLSVFKTKKEAKSSCKYEKKTKGIKLYPYKCKKCGSYHLSSTRFKINYKENSCSCTDSYSKNKYLYKSFFDAYRTKRYLKKTKGVRLFIYKCPEKKGYHLTHKK